MPKGKTRRNNSEGSITFETDRQKYQAKIVDSTGKRLSKRFNTKEEAVAWLSTIKSSMARNTYIPDNDITVMGWVLEYLETYKIKNIRIKTMERYFQTAKHLDPIGDIPLQKLTAHAVQQFYNDLNMSNSSNLKVHKLLCAAYKKAHALDIVSKNIMLAVEPPKVQHKEVEIFTQEELTKISKSILNSKHYDKYYPIYLTAITTGARLGEILGLKRQDLHSGYITINDSLQQCSQGLYDAPPKTAAGKRRITITLKLQQILNRLVADDKIISLDGYVFHTKNGTPYSPRNFERVWASILKEAGIPHKKFHALRHTHATQLLAAGIPILEVSRRLGHSKASHTLNLYGHAIPEYDKTLPDKISKIFAF